MKRLLGLMALVGLAVLGGCASVGGPAAQPGAAAAPSAPAAASAYVTPGDPFERWNRRVYAFNDAVDSALLKPAAEAYRAAVPALVRTGIDNVLGNVGDVWSAANHLMQGKLQTGAEMGMRVLTNTVFGLGGLLDPATEMGLTRRSEDFGQTLGRWGVGAGPFLMLPVLGPSTLRDGLAWPVDRLVAPSSLPSQDGARIGLTGLELLRTRANLLQTTQLLDQVALDRYSFTRDAYLSRRLDQVYDGAPPMETYEDEPAEPATPAAKPAEPGTPAAKATAGAASAVKK